MVKAGGAIRRQRIINDLSAMMASAHGAYRMGRGSVAALSVALIWALLACPFATRVALAEGAFGDAALAGEIQQLGSRLARSLPHDTEQLYLIWSIDEELRLDGNDRCRVVHVTAAHKGAAVATAQAIACPTQAGWALRDETVRP